MNNLKDFFNLAFQEQDDEIIDCIKKIDEVFQFNKRK